VVLTQTLLLSQEKPSTILAKPKKYQNPVNENDLAPSEERMALQAWIVWSDREDNQTYTEANGGGQPFKKLRFLEQCYVTEEDGEWVRIAKDPSPTLLSLSKGAEDYGWIDKRNLLLWQTCLMTEHGKIPKKAMILNTVNQLKKRKGKPDIVEFTSHPSDTTYKSGKESQLFQFFFVLKTIGQSILLSRDQLVPLRNPGDAIVGWAPIERVSLWDHRVAIEPNWDAEAAQERRRGQKARILGDAATANDYRNGRSVPIERILWEQDTYDKRPQGEVRRFPVFGASRVSPAIFEVGAMGSIYPDDMTTEYDQFKVAQVQKQLGDVNTFKRWVNVVFVIDGTTSMEPYFGAMARAIAQTMPILTQQAQSKNKFRFGAVIYRDFAEGPRKSEVMPVQSEYGKVQKFLQDAKVGDLYDRDIPEAVYFGLNEALRRTGVNQKETNIVFLVGDAGNHHRNDETQIDPDKIVQTIVYLDCHFVVFQVHHESDPSYDEFVTQMLSIIEGAAEAKYRQVQRLASDSKPHPSIVTEGTNHILVNGSFVSAVYALNRGEEIQPQVLTARVTEEVAKLDTYIDASARSLNDMIDGKAMGKAIVERQELVQIEGKMYSTAFAPGIMNYLVRAGLTQEDLKVLGKDKYQLYVNGYVTMKTANQQYNLFKRDLFLTRLELVTLANTMTELARSTEERKDLKETWIAILKAYIGKLDEEELRMNLSQAQEKVFGLPGTNEFLRNVRIADITDPAVFPDSELRKYVNRITSMSTELRKIADMPETEFRYAFRSNDQTYFWIEEDLIP
jgi:hypothetical protein